ncbi:RNA-directed DNA polymerase, eukaryota, reverse transcriptase zinc-binding domain protein [Tanacetum coccineum]|uniref:RNA-directed DNA polymerase, eukaryota, reverse transcriptase zinc-binding domain protein n=1 Tax=Tanacetum coccineum TaxID=301880 RepID=A0ABQ5BGF4_9ASTR
MAPEFWCQTNATEFWCHSISGAKLSFADVAPLFEFGTKSLAPPLPTWILEVFRLGPNEYYTRHMRYPRIVAWTSNKKFYRPMLRDFLHGLYLLKDLIPDEEQRSGLDQMMKQGQNIFEKMKKYMEELNVGTGENREPIIADQHYGLSDLSGFQSIQGGPSTFQTPTNNSIFNMGTPTNWQTSMPSQPGSSNWQSQMPAYTPTPNWQPPIPSHPGDAGLCDPRPRRVQRPSVYIQSPYTPLPPTTELPKKRVGKTKKNSKNDNLSPMNLGNAFAHDNVGGDDCFFTCGEIPKGCNSTFIALIPKNPDANMVKDFRPISLIGSIYKIIAKILTNRLVGVLGDIVNEVQSAFISERQILDGPFILNEIMQWCRRRKKQSLIFKVDFEKAYDSVRWDFLDDILVKFGFGIKWRGWIQNCLNSSKGSILVNGSPTEEFQFYKGLKQGDPLSPFLFILVMESLHISFQRVVDVGMFTGIKLSSSLNISHLFYADDAIFLGQWNDSNIDTLVHVMECFYRVSGLRINLCKSKIMGIHVDADRIKSAASKLGCLVLNTPFLYLGTKVGENMSRVHAWKEVIVKIKSRLSNWKLKTLSIGGRFTLLKSVLGSTPIFHMSIYKVPSSVLHLLESIRSHFFHGHDPRSKKASWVNWNKVLTAKERGGLGVSSLYALNRGLMCKWVWRFFAHKSLLWSRVIKAIHGPEGGLITDVRRGFRSTWTSIVQEVKKLQNQGVNIFDYIRIKIGNGDNTSFWKDKWHNEGVLKDVFPRLYALERHQNVTIHTKLIDYSLVNSFRRNPRSGVEEFQLDNLSRLVSTITLSSAVDRYVWSLENSGEFSVKSIRQVIDANCFPVIHSATRWVKSVPLKVNIMAWKIKMDGLPTRMNISRRGIEIDSIVCPICNSGAESSCHIFFQCNLVRQLARKISSWWNVDYVDVSSYEEWYTWLVSLRLQANLKAVFEGIFYCLWWSVWMFRNKILFEKDTPSQARIFDNIVSNSYYWCKFRCKALFKWIDWLKNPYLVIV